MIDDLSIEDVCKLALKHRLYVPGWSMHDYFTRYLKGHVHLQRAALYYVDGIPVGAAFVQSNNAMQCFVRKNMRRQKIGSKLIEHLRNSLDGDKYDRVHAGIGLKAGSGAFWRSNKVVIA